MLGVHGVARSGAEYYLSDVGRELPAGGLTHWTGSAATALGLRGQVDMAGLRLLLEGQHPVTGRPTGTGRTRVAGWDLTFSAPKSVSVLFALGGSDAARAAVTAHDLAVSGAVGYLERHGLSAVRRHGAETRVLATTGLVGARVTHAVNRNEDPHLHTHVVMANLVHGSDGMWGACDRRGLEAHRGAADAVYLAHLRATLTSSINVRWAAGREWAIEMEGVPPALLGEFSSRGAEIRRQRHEFGSTSRRGGRVAWAATRSTKTPSRAYGELAVEWAARGRALGIDRLQVVRGTRPRTRQVDEHRFAASVWVTPHGGAHRRDAVAALGGAALDGIAADDLERMVDRWVAPAWVGVAETLHPRRAVVPAAHLLRALGPRPLVRDDHEVWMDAAAALDGYRHRWGVRSSVEPLGPSAPLRSAPTRRVVDHLRTAGHIEAARARLERGAPRAVHEVERGLGL